MMDAPLLAAEGLTKEFGGLTAVNNVTFNVEEGAIFGLIGPNGAGKSTLLNCLAGATRPNAGTIIFDGHETTGLPADKMCHLGVSRTFQIPRPFPRRLPPRGPPSSFRSGRLPRRPPSCSTGAAPARPCRRWPCPRRPPRPASRSPAEAGSGPVTTPSGASNS